MTKASKTILRAIAGWLTLVLASPLPAQDHTSHGDHGMRMDAGGMTMNHNPERLPRDCSQIAGEYSFEVRAGRRHAAGWPGAMYGFSINELDVEPCSRVTVTLVNDDEVRHQWMLHGLPRYLYPGGMFHLEASGGQNRTGSFIVPSDHRTYLVHCDMPQHMEKGMKAQLKAGRGSGDLWSVPGLSGDLERPAYPGQASWPLAAAQFLLVLLIALLASRR